MKVVEEESGNLVITDFDEMEAYRIACKIEEDGIEFYKRLADKIIIDKTKQIIAFLLSQEEKHLKFFLECLSRLREKKEDLSEEIDLLSSMDYGIFQPYQSIAELDNILNQPRRALKLGIVIENNSIKFYAACKNNISSQEAKKRVALIILEETKHREILEDALNHL